MIQISSKNIGLNLISFINEWYLPRQFFNNIRKQLNVQLLGVLAKDNLRRYCQKGVEFPATGRDWLRNVSGISDYPNHWFCNLDGFMGISPPN
jgi:hypothetical protein